jgi:Mg2+-importing ATPase
MRITPKYLTGIAERGFNVSAAPRSNETTQLLLTLGTSQPELALEKLRTTIEGLSAEEAARRIEEYGRNEVAHEGPPPWWLQLCLSFVNPFTGILAALATVSFFTDVVFNEAGEDWTKVILIGSMIFLSGIVSFAQERRSLMAVEKLRDLVQNKSLIRRASWDDDEGLGLRVSGAREIPVDEIVPGDIVQLAAGDMVPADIRLLRSVDLFLSQSALTGESMPVEKFAVMPEVSGDAAAVNNPLSLNTVCFMGTNVISGSADGVVVATGGKTYFGSMARRLTGQRALTSFDKGVNSVSWLLIRFMLVMVPVVFLLNGFTKGQWYEALFFALAVAVGLTPEMLPLIVTANLAKGAIKMAKQKAIVKKLNAIQNLGAMNILCTDKTGTITENRIVLVRHLDPGGRENDRVLELAYLNSRFQTGLRNLMDQAIIDRAEKYHGAREGLGYHKIDEVPFDFSRRRMSVVVQEDGGNHILICKGAVAEVLAHSTRMELNGHVVPLDDETRARMHELSMELNREGLRTVAVAYRSIAKKRSVYTVPDEEDLVLIGYMGFLDPPKASAREALRRLAEDGIETKIITGDNEIVTERICKEVGLEHPTVMLGDAVDALSLEELAKQAETTTIFARIEPLQKARIVEALKSRGHTVGYLGDGVNDAAAMRESDVGISVDTAVDIAKEAADIILLENDLLVLQHGVVEGRTVFGNIMKYLKMTASSNFGNVLSVLIASVFLPFLPMLPIQLLLLDLLYNISQLSIPWDKMYKEFLRIPRKWEATGIARFMLFIGPTSSLFDLTTFLLLWFVFKADSIATQSLFQTGWFIESLFTQTLIVHVIRTPKMPFLREWASAPVVLLTSAIMALGVTIPFTPLGHAFGLTPLPALYFPLLVVTLIAYCILAQLIKDWFIRTFRVWI